MVVFAQAQSLVGDYAWKEGALHGVSDPEIAQIRTPELFGDFFSRILGIHYPVQWLPIADTLRASVTRDMWHNEDSESELLRVSSSSNVQVLHKFSVSLTTSVTLASWALIRFLLWNIFLDQILGSLVRLLRSLVLILLKPTTSTSSTSQLALY